MRWRLPQRAVGGKRAQPVAASRNANAAACAYPPGFAPLEEPRTCDAPRAVRLW